MEQQEDAVSLRQEDAAQQICIRSEDTMSNTIAPPTNTVRFLIVTSVTSINIFFGVLALFASTAGNIHAAALCLLACVAIDGCDGALARHWNVTSAFGTQLDSLADMTSFTIASAVLTFYWFQPNAPFGLMVGASFLYVLSGAIRLARFNVSLPSSQYFQGLATTVASAIIATTYLAYPQLNSQWGVLLVVLLALLMVSMFPYPKFRQFRKLPAWVWGIVCGGMVINLSWTVWLASLFYMLTGPIIWVYRRYSKR